MNSKSLVTIYVLVYNNVDGLKTTIESVVSQDYENAEIIISDDGSSNYDKSCLEEYAGKVRNKYKNVRVNINEENIGTVKHLNRVFGMAKGDILITCSSGDEFADSKAVSRLVDYFEKTDYLVITTRRIDRYKDHDKVRPSWLLGPALRFMPKTVLNYMIQKKNIISGSCTFYRKEIFDKHGLLDERYHLVEDYPYYVNLLRKSEKIGFYSKPVIVHTIGGVSTGKIHPSIYKDIERLREDLYPVRSEFSKKTCKFLETAHNSKSN